MLPIPLLIPPETPGFNLAVSPAGGGSCSLPAPSLPTNPLRRLEQEGSWSNAAPVHRKEEGASQLAISLVFPASQPTTTQNMVCF